jgi:dienelactone hydrolase
MRRAHSTQRLILLTTTLMAAWAWGAPAPTQYFATLPTFADVDLAPDGRHISMLRAFNGRYHLSVANVEDGTSKLLLSGNRQRLRWCRFASDARILCAADRSGEGQGPRTRLQAINVDGSGRLTLLPAALGERAIAPSAFHAQVVSWLRDDPDHVLLAAHTDASGVTIVRVNVRTNAQEPVAADLPPLESWYADAAGEVRLGAGFIGADFNWVARPPGSETFRALPPARDQEWMPPRVLGFAKGGASFHAALRGESGRVGVYELSTADGTVLAPVLEDERFDFDGNLTYAADGSLLAARYTRDLPGVRFYDPAWDARVAAIRRAVSRDAVVPLRWDRTGNRFVVVAMNRGQPSEYYFYDSDPDSGVDPETDADSDAEGPDLVHLGTNHPRLDELGTVRVLEYPTRDGYAIPAYLTVPWGRSPRRLPTVVMPHDGPAARDDARFDYLVQFLASRGYAVLQPNFRGSTGYGRAHLDAGFRQWGLRMQDDVVDGIDWLTSQGIADAGRVCIVGRGYGGYVALMAAIKTPRKIRCAVSDGGISDLRALLTNPRDYGFDRLNRTLISRGMRSWQLLEANSPIHNADRVDVPLLVLHGEADRVVSVDQSRGLVRALAAAAKEYRYVEQPGGDHAHGTEAHRLRFLAELEAFLALYL